MAETAIVTGASRGIGLAIAETLAGLGYSLTISARQEGPLEETAEKLREGGVQVNAIAANLADPDAPARIVAAHKDAFGRLDVLVNNAGLGIGAAAAEHQTKFLDMQWNVNVRAIVLLYRESLELLRASAKERGTAQVINLSSIAGKSGQPWLSMYGATKAAVVSYTEAMNKELGSEGIRSVALCPGFVDTDMAEFVKDGIGQENMIKTSDIAESVRFLLKLSPACLVGEIVFQRPGEAIDPGA